MRAVARLPPESLEALSRVVETGGKVAVYGGKALSVTQKVLPVVGVAITTVCLSYEILQYIKRWWNGEISGSFCVKKIIDCGAGVAGGVAGGIGFTMAGTWMCTVAGPVGLIGAVVGTVVASIIASKTAEYLSGRLTEWIFGLPREETLARAYEFLNLSSSASNSDINSRYRHLALVYHPDRGGNRDMWLRLQYYVAVIRQARENS